MRRINTNEIKEKVCELFIQANYKLPQDIFEKIENAVACEEKPIAKSILSKLIENCDAAEKINVPICQDTGMAVVFVELGQEVYLEGDNFEDAVNAGVREAYDKGYMRKSVVDDPFFNRKNTDDNTPAIIYTKIVPGDRIKITAAPKGFGSENMSAVKMFTPSAKREDIIDFVVDTMKKAGSNPCPPVVIGVGIGGDFEYAAYLSKKALIRETSVKNPHPEYARLEQDMLSAVNELPIGPQGFGGKTTCLAVNVEYFPTHIAGLPCAVNIGCHVTRHASCII
ncbi:MAG: fumarate hydratase [Ruminococcaceae bacterium]|nr:fumarate hydratase [Oscillospiraceae bacterium]